VADNNQGNVFVAYLGDVTEYAASGSVLTTLNLSGLSTITALAADNQGDVFVAGQIVAINNLPAHAAVEEYSATGQLTTTYSNGLSDPSALLVDSKGDLYIADADNNSVQEYNAQGTLLRTLFSRGFYSMDAVESLQGCIHGVLWQTPRR